MVVDVSQIGRQCFKSVFEPLAFSSVQRQTHIAINTARGVWRKSHLQQEHNEQRGYILALTYTADRCRRLRLDAQTLGRTQIEVKARIVCQFRNLK